MILASVVDTEDTPFSPEVGLFAVAMLVIANGFFVAAEFALVAVRRSRIDQLVADVRRHRVQGVVCWRLDRLGRNLRHLVLLLDEWQSRGVAFVTLGEGIDTSTAAGRLVAGLLGSIAQFERERIRERILAGLRRARAQGRRLGRPRRHQALVAPVGGSVRSAALAWGVSKSTAARWIISGRKNGSAQGS